MTGEVGVRKYLPPYTRHECPMCQRDVLVNTDGTLRAHNKTSSRRSPQCVGSRRKVLEVAQE